MRGKRVLILGVLTGLAISSGGTLAGPAQQAPATQASETPVTRVYDVRDLMVFVEDYPLAGALVPPTRIQQPPVPASPPPASFMGSGPKPTTGDSLDQVRKTISDLIDPTGWKDNGGDVGYMVSFNDQLIISQTPTNQAAIQALLAELRKSRTMMVRVRADWVLLPPGQIDQILKNGGQDATPLPEVSRDRLQKLPADTVHFSGDISCFSGQVVHLASGRARTFITESIPIVATGATAYQATTKIVQYGTALQVAAAIANGSATLDLMSETSEADSASQPPTTQPIEGKLDRLDAVVQHFHTTIQVQLNKPVLVGGMTLEPTLSVPAGQQLYLIVEADAAQ